MTRYFEDTRTRKCVKVYRFLSFAGNVSAKYGKVFTKTGLDTVKTSSEKVVHETLSNRRIAMK